MALEYTLHFKTQESAKVQIENILEVLEWHYKQEVVSEKCILFSFVNSPGFTIYFMESFNRHLTINDSEYDFDSSMTFRISKESSPSIYKKNLIKFALSFIKRSNYFSVLLFNGEQVILVNDDKGLVVNNNGFWFGDLIDELEGFTYIQKSFDLL
ncbi:hypothetical protein JMN32_19030 [Fulvivirga sp. 29W222]|uniref:Uncharacterized protein n=1 Tax=Fulvivirga marina TaxID=2494733 RepID=A0A937KFL8_9BACT|nr:SitI3 family protein [Fulvivirga marina]MBL6448415.1 hypothetical protein [Fulvivirga marina]